MRAFVLMLLVLDCLLLAWGLLARDAPNRSLRPPPPLPLGVDRLRLLSDVAPGVVVQPPTAREGAAADRVCLRVGPLPDEASARAVEQRALSRGFTATIESSERGVGPPDFQVHLPPLPSAEQASRAVREFAALDIEAYVIPNGDLEGGVSLGIFTSPQNAEARRAEVARLGYPVRIVEIARSRRIWHVLLQGGDAEALAAFVPDLRADWSGLSAETVACERATAAPGGPEREAATAGTPPRAASLPADHWTARRAAT